MAAWHGRQCESPSATFAGIGGYRRRGTRLIAPRRSAAQPCGTRAALTEGRGRRELRLGAAKRRRRRRRDDEAGWGFCVNENVRVGGKGAGLKKGDDL